MDGWMEQTAKLWNMWLSCGTYRQAVEHMAKRWNICSTDVWSSQRRHGHRKEAWASQQMLAKRHGHRKRAWLLNRCLDRIETEASKTRHELDDKQLEHFEP
eukprot:4853178-Heterocapsa_arctica.AAC.1